MNKLFVNWTIYFPLFLQFFRFGIVGLLAAALHFAVVVFLVQWLLFIPLAANIFGFLVAFQLSYWGHRLWTFQEKAVLHRVALPRLILIQLINFSANEFLFYVFLLLHLPYPLALSIVLTVLPIFTFISNKRWVFR